MFKLLPLTILALLLAIPVHVEVLISQRSAWADSTNSSASGFGDHPRPWAKDLQQTGVDTGKGGTDNVNGLKPAAATVTEGEAVKDCGSTQPVDEAEVFRLKAAEQRIAEQVARLSALKRELEVLLQKRSEKEEASISHLANIYRNMKPEEAARLLEDMSPDLVVKVIGAMKDREAAPILAKFSKAAAHKVTGDIAESHSLKKLDIAR